MNQRGILLRRLVLASALSLLGGCGFHLRGSSLDARLPEALATLWVTMAGQSVHEPLAVEVREALKEAGAELYESPNVPRVVLLDERVETRVASVRTETGKASEYTMHYIVSFRLDGPSPVETQHIRLQREYTFDPARVVAKEYEERELLRDMRHEAARQLVYRLVRATTAR
jgi:LPS-assembly lipoprotein